MRKFFGLLAAITIFTALPSRADVTLFDYPVAPDTCSTIESRCNYLVQHFWDKCELAKPFDERNDSLLVEAMATYLDIMRAGANVNVSLASIRDLMFKAQGNHTNFERLMAVAEFLLYARPTPVIDDVYLTFAQSAADASWAKKEFREHYGDQVQRIKNTKLGEPVTDLELTLVDGTKTRLRDLAATADVTFVFITDYAVESNLDRTRLYTDIAVNAALDNGSLKVVNIMAGDVPKSWDETSRNYSARWTVGASKNAMDVLDLRILPCVIVLDREGKVQAKNLTVDNIKGMVQ